jgi:ribosomal protein S18 acetylase RimI-like enzyme
MTHRPVTEIRTATPLDTVPVQDLVRAAYAKWVPLIGREPAPMKADYDRAIREHRIDILYVDGRMVGLIETVMHPDHLWIENVAITPERQGKGLGRHLLAHAETTAAAAGRFELRLLTNGAFEANIALYKALGYRVDKSEPFLSGTAVFMSKRIA